MIQISSWLHRSEFFPFSAFGILRLQLASLFPGLLASGLVDILLQLSWCILASLKDVFARKQGICLEIAVLEGHQRLAGG